MKRLMVSSTVAGLFVLGLSAMTLAPSAGAANGFLVHGAHATARPAVAPHYVTPGSVWTLTTPGVGCNVETFGANHVVTTDTGFSGKWKEPTVNTIKERFPTASAKYKGTASSPTSGYTGTLKLGGTNYPGTTLTPGATAGC